MTHRLSPRKTIAAICAFTAITSTAADFKITDYGVTTDSTIVQTRAIQSVIDAAEAAGGGRIVVPEGTFLTGGLFFKPGTTLHLEKGAVIKGSDDIADYPLIPSRMEGRSIYYYAALINAYYVDNFAITGPGTVNGNALKFWEEFWALRKVKPKCTNQEVHRPRLVFLWGCDGLHIDGPTLCNSAFWTTHLYQCNNVLIENTRMEAPREPVRAPSSDALDLDACRNVTVRNCYLNCDDDGACLKGGKGVFAHISPENGIVENILVENCTFGPNLHGVLTLGSECIHAKNVTVRNCKLQTRCSILRLKMRPDTYQTYENITVQNITGTCATVIEMRPWKQFFDLEGTDEKPVGIVRDILVENIDVDCKSFGHIAGNPDDTVSNFTVRNVNIKATDPNFVCAYPQIVFDNVTINGKKIENPAK